MTREDIFETLTEIFQDVFDDEDIELTDATTAEDIEDWDSLMQIRLLASIEKEFSVKFPIEETMRLKNVGEMVSAILEKFV